MPTNWPPKTAPSWPPKELGGVYFSASNVTVLYQALEEAKFTSEPPTKEEFDLYFRTARCDHKHEVLGRMFISPDKKRRYPVAVCVDEKHEDVLVQFFPYYCGADSASVDNEKGELKKTETIDRKYWEIEWTDSKTITSRE